MTSTIQICVDCKNAHAQADWWAETLDWMVEPTDQDFIDSLLQQGFAQPEQLMVHNGHRVWKDGAAICRPGEEGTPDRLRILFQPVPEPKTVKDRLHLDVRLDGRNKDEARSALEARGATYLYAASQGPSSWYTMADPEGNEFCIS